MEKWLKQNIKNHGYFTRYKLNDMITKLEYQKNQLVPSTTAVEKKTALCNKNYKPNIFSSKTSVAELLLSLKRVICPKNIAKAYTYVVKKASKYNKYF